MPHPPVAAPSLRYTRVAIALHWLIGIALAGQVAFGAWMSDLPRGTPLRAAAFNWHKSCGLLLLALIVLRLAWRVMHAPPAWPAALGAWRGRTAHAVHATLYALMLAVPLAGYVASNFTQYGVKLFNAVLLPPWGPQDKAMYALFNGAHRTGAWLLVALVALHAAVGLWHLQRRDGVFARMWPARKEGAT